MQRILVPTDFSENSKLALKHAIKIVNQLGGTVSVLHVFQAVTIPGSFETIDKVEKEEHEQELLDLFKEMKPLLTDKARIEGFVKKGSSIDTICETADKLNVSMIVMGTTGADGMKKLFLGSTASNVILETSKAVLAIPKEFQNFKLSNITLALDTKKIKDVQILKPIIELVSKFDAVLNLLTVIHEAHPKAKIDPSLEDYLNQKKITYTYFIVKAHDIMMGIREFVARENSDMLCLIHHPRGFFDNLFGPSVAKEMAFDSSVPILVIPG